jgi:tetratricopeptide (TPR) repeat protein
LHNLADLVRQQGDIARALSLRQGSLEIFEHIGDVQGKAATLTNMAHAIAQQGDTARALDLWQESLEIKERIGDVKGRGDTLHEMALVIAQQGDFARALDLSQQALELSERIGDAEGKAASLNQMAVVIAQQGDIARALDLWEQSLEIKERIGDVQGKAATLANMAWVANKSGDPARGDQLNTHTQAAQALGSVRAYLDLITVLRNLGATAQKERSIYAAQAAWLVIRVQVPVPASIRTLETLLSPLSRRGLASGGIRRTDRDLGQRGTVKLKLAERGTRLPNKLWIREVRKLTESGEQVSLISTHLGLDARALAASLFARWAQENFFRYMRQNYAIDTLVERGDEAISDTEVAVNPAWRTLDRDVRKQNAALTKERARFAGVGLTEPLSDAEVIHYQLGQAQQQAKVEGLQRQLDQLKQKRKATPHHIPVKDLPEKDRFTRLLSERKHFIDTIKMICYRAENSMMSIIREKMGRADDAHSFLRQIYNLDVDLVSDLQANTLTIRLHHLAQAAHDDVARHLCDQLNETETLFPDTQLKLLFKVGSA